MQRHLLILLLLQCVFSSKAQVLSLDSILNMIEKNNPALAVYEAQANAFNEYAKGAKAWEAPQLSAGFFMTPYNTNLWKGSNAETENNKGMGAFMIQGQQMIPNPSKQKANLKYMQSMSAVEIANRNDNRNKLFASAKNDYYEWLIIQKKLSLLDEQEQLVNYIIQTAEIRYPYEKAKLSSIYKAKAELAEIQTTRLMLESELEWRRVSLNQLMNRNKNTLFEIDTTLSTKAYEKKNIDTSDLVSRRSDIAAIDKAIQVSKYQQAYERSQLKPDFGIQYAHMFAFGNSPNLFSLMGMIRIPIAPWSSGAYRSTQQGLNYKIMHYQKQREAIVNEATGELEVLKWKMSKQKQQIALYEKTLLPALQKNYKASLLSYEQNTEDLFVVLDAIEALEMGKMELLNKKRELLLLQTEYEKTTEQL